MSKMCSFRDVHLLDDPAARNVTFLTQAKWRVPEMPLSASPVNGEVGRRREFWNCLEPIVGLRPHLAESASSPVRSKADVQRLAPPRRVGGAGALTAAERTLLGPQLDGRPSWVP